LLKNIKRSTNELNNKNLEKSIEFSEFLKLHNVLKLTTSLGKKFQKVPNVDNASSKEMSAITTTLLLRELKPMTACSTAPA